MRKIFNIGWSVKNDFDTAGGRGVLGSWFYPRKKLQSTVEEHVLMGKIAKQARFFGREGILPRR